MSSVLGFTLIVQCYFNSVRRYTGIVFQYDKNQMLHSFHLCFLVGDYTFFEDFFENENLFLCFFFLLLVVHNKEYSQQSKPKSEDNYILIASTYVSFVAVCFTNDNCPSGMICNTTVNVCVHITTTTTTTTQHARNYLPFNYFQHTL